MEQRRARIAVIGAGWWSTFTHMPGLLDHPDADIVALCDADDARLRAAADRFGIAHTYTDVGEMLRHEQIDGAVIAVYHAAHYDVARACLDAGVHIMLEKPMVLQAAHALTHVRAPTVSRLLLATRGTTPIRHGVRARG